MARFRARAPRTGTVDVKRLICVRVRFLLDVTCNIEYFMNSLCHYFKEKLQESQSSQYTHFSKNDVLSYVEEFGMPDSDKVYHEMLIKKNDVPMSIPTHNVMSLIYELLSLHLENIIFLMNKKI